MTVQIDERTTKQHIGNHDKVIKTGFATSDMAYDWIDSWRRWGYQPELGVCDVTQVSDNNYTATAIIKHYI